MIVSEPVTPKARKHRINYALAATLVATGVTLADAAKQTGAKNANVLACGLRRKGVTATIARSLEPTPNQIKTVTARIANKASEILRQDMGELLQAHVSQLKHVPAKADLRHLAQVGAVLEPLARTAKIVHDWGNETSQGIIAFGVVEQMDQAQDVIDLAPGPALDTPQDPPAQAS